MRPPLVTCSVCEELFDPEDVIEIAGCVSCAECKPALIARFQQGTLRSDHTVARDGSFLVVGRQSLLPGRCVRCNKPTEHYYRVKTKGHGRALGGLLTVSRRVTCEVGLCETHLKVPQQSLVVGWTLAVLWLPLALVFALFGGAAVFAFFLVSVCIWQACGAGLRPVRVSRLTDDCIWLRGACPAYLDELPEYWSG